MKFNPPTTRIFLISLLLGGAAIAARYFVSIPFIGSYSFEMLTAAFVLLVLSCIFKGL